MRFKDNVLRRKPTEDEIQNLTYPKDKFDLISVDYVDEWDQHKTDQAKDSPLVRDYTYRRKAVHVTVRCKKCGTIKVEATDRPDMSCKVGPCISKWKDLTGQRFGKLLVESLDLTTINSKQEKKKWYWNCLCDCGNHCLKLTTDLVNRYHRMCPTCARKESVRKTTLPGQQSKWNRMIRIYKKNAAHAEREFSLTDEQFVKLASSNCVYCGAPPSLGGYDVVCNGIDRVDATKGYTPENSVTCCYRCNYMKNKLTTEEFFNHVKRIYEHSNLGSKFNDHPEREYTSSEVEKGASQE